MRDEGIGLDDKELNSKCTAKPSISSPTVNLNHSQDSKKLPCIYKADGSLTAAKKPFKSKLRLFGAIIEELTTAQYIESITAITQLARLAPIAMLRCLGLITAS